MKEFLKLTTNKQIEFISDSEKEPFWLERLRTAIEKNAPQCINFSDELMAVYWAIKSRKTVWNEED